MQMEDITFVIEDGRNFSEAIPPSVYQYVRELESKKKVLEADFQTHVDEIAKLDAANRTIAAQTKHQVEASFVASLFDYDEGCEDGKVRFCEYLGLDVPSLNYEATISVTISRGVDIDELCSDIERAIDNYVGGIDRHSVGSFEEV